MVSADADGLECGSFVNDPYKRRSHFPSLVGAIHESPGFKSREALNISTLHSQRSTLLLYPARYFHVNAKQTASNYEHI